MAQDFPIEEGLRKDPITAPDELLRAGISIFYGDDRYPDPDLLVREDPDGTKTLVRFNGTAWDEVRRL